MWICNSGSVRQYQIPQNFLYLICKKNPNEYFNCVDSVQWLIKLCIVMMTKEGTTKIVNFMTPRAGVLVLGYDHIRHKVKMH